jgi:hypothetical protein
MEQTPRREERPIRSGRLGAALKSSAQLCVAAVACALWIGLALPGLQLLPGIGDLANTSVAISLQSALLGIDDSSSSSSVSVRAALHALGLKPTPQLLPRDLLRLRGVSASGSLVTQLDPRVVGAPDAGPSTSAPLRPVTAAPPALPQSPLVVFPLPLNTAPTPRPPHAPKPVVPPAPPAPPAPSPPPSLNLQTIAFTSTPPANAVVGVVTYVVSAKASSGLPVAFSAEPSSSGICTVSGTTVTLVGTGTCTIDADQPGNGGYHAAARVQQSFAIGSGARSASVQTINFGSVPPGAAIVGGSAPVVASASSGLPVDLWATSDSSGVCHVIGTIVHFDGIGTCTIRASQPGDANYQTAPLVQQTFAVGPILQTISFTSTPPAGAVAGISTYTVSATATSGLPVVFSADPTSASVCIVSGSTVTPVGAGTCIIDANQFGDGSHQAAPEVQQSFSVGGGAPSLSVQSIHFSSSTPGGAVVGSAYGIAAAASSGLPVAFAVDASSAGVCTLAGTTVSLVGTGTCTIDADQPGNGSYLPASQVQQSFSVGKDPQTISFATPPPAGAVVGGPAYTVAATASSALAVAFSADASSAGVCTLSGSTVSFVGPGTCTVNADQAGNGTFQPAVQVQQSFAVTTPSLSVQSINFSSTPPGGAVIGSPYTVSATASSSLPVTFSTDLTSAGVCTVSGSTVSLVGTGTCTINADQSGNGSYLPAPEVQQSFAVGRDSQTISFISAPPAGAVTGGSYAVSATSSSTLAVAISADASSAGVCTVSGSTVSFVGAGTCTVDADQSGNATFQPAVQVQQSFAVTVASLSVQSITFTSTVPAGATAGGSTYTVSAAASSGLAVAFSADASSAGICSVSGSTVSFVGSGTCTVDANQSGNGSYQAAAQEQQSFPVGFGAQTISFTSIPPSPAAVGDPDYVVSADATSGLAVVFSADASSAGICTVSGSSVTLVGAGTCTIDANQPGDATHQPAPQVEQTFAIGGAPAPSVQSISFTSTAPAGAMAGGSAYTVAATSSSGLAVVFSADAASAAVCTVSGSTVSFVGAGTCTIDGDQSGNASYQAAPQVQQSFAVGLSGQTISFTSTPPGSAVVGGAGYTVTATASSGLAVAFTLSAGSAGVCTMSGATVSFVGAGTCTVDANQAGDATHQAAPQAQQSFTVAGSPPPKSPQSISFTSSAPSGAVVGGPTYSVTATAGSGLAVVFSAAGSSAGICTVSGATVSFVGSGTCTINANQPGNGSYLAAPQAQQAFAVGLTPQTISFTSSPPAGAVAGGAGYTVTATASSGLAVTFTISAGSAGVCTISGAAVSFVGGGTCTINANQPGNGSYLAAPQALQSFTVAGSPPPKSPQSINFTSTAPAGSTVGGSAYTVTATASSGLAVAFSAAAGSAGICTVSGSTVSLVGAGTCTINANQAGNGSYLAAPQKQQSFTISKRSQTISFTSTPPGGAVVGGAFSYTVAATATSGLAVVFSAAPSSAGICTVSGSTVSIVGAGTCTINANQAGNGTYQAAAQVQQSFTIGRGSQTITITSDPGNNVHHHDAPYTITATATSGLAVVFTTDPSSAGVCSVSGNSVTFIDKGQCIIYADQPGNANWLPAPQTEQSFRVK